MNPDSLYQELANKLKAERNEKGYWEGRLSSSALAVAVSIVALQMTGNPAYRSSINRGLQWLLANQNPDGGYGDSPSSLSNVSTSLLCYGAVFFCGQKDKASNAALKGIVVYLETRNIFLSENLVEAVVQHYGTVNHTSST